MTPIGGVLAIVRCFMMIVLCLSLSSCKQRHSLKAKSGSTHQSDRQNNSVYFDTIVQQEAMLIDIPIPLYDQRIIPESYQATEPDTLAFGYKSPLLPSQAIEFFINQMERYGWRHLVLFNTVFESILQFESPDRYCTVIIKGCARERFGSSIFIYIKRASV